MKKSRTIIQVNADFGTIHLQSYRRRAQYCTEIWAPLIGQFVALSSFYSKTNARRAFNASLAGLTRKKGAA